MMDGGSGNINPGQQQWWKALHLWYMLFSTLSKSPPRPPLHFACLWSPEQPSPSASILPGRLCMRANGGSRIWTSFGHWAGKRSRQSAFEENCLSPWI